MTKWVVLVLVWAGVGYAQQEQGSLDLPIAGTVRGEDGTLVSGAVVSLRYLDRYVGRPRQTEWIATTDAAGAFRFAVLTPGRHRLCVHTPGSLWLNPCDWGLDPPVVSVSAAKKADSVGVVLRLGAALRVRVEDPGQLLAQHEGKTPGANLLVGVEGGSPQFHAAPVVSAESAGRTYQVVIPYGTALWLMVASGLFQLNDALGLPVARTGLAVIPVMATPGQAVPSVNLVVAGKAH